MGNVYGTEKERGVATQRGFPTIALAFGSRTHREAPGR